MFKFIFYALGIVAIMYEWWAINTFDRLDAFRKKLKAQKGVAAKDMKLTVNESILALFHLLYMVWAFIGLFSSQWVLFGLLILLSLFHGKFWSKGWNKFDSIFSILIIVTAILNTYHFHYDIFQGILTYLFGK